MFIINVESGQLTRVPRAPQQRREAAAATRAAAAADSAAGPGFVFARDGRTLYFRSGTGANGALYAATINLQANQNAGGARRRRAARRQRARSKSRRAATRRRAR